MVKDLSVLEKEISLEQHPLLCIVFICAHAGSHSCTYIYLCTHSGMHTFFFFYILFLFPHHLSTSHYSFPFITTLLSHPPFFPFPPSAMQQLFIDSNDQWEWVLWEPSHLDARGTQQTSQPEPSPLSTETPGRPQDVPRPWCWNTVWCGWSPTNWREGML